MLIRSTLKRSFLGAGCGISPTASQIAWKVWVQVQKFRSCAWERKADTYGMCVCAVRSQQHQSAGTPKGQAFVSLPRVRWLQTRQQAGQLLNQRHGNCWSVWPRPLSAACGLSAARRGGKGASCQPPALFVRPLARAANQRSLVLPGTDPLHEASQMRETESLCVCVCAECERGRGMKMGGLLLFVYSLKKMMHICIWYIHVWIK